MVAPHSDLVTDREIIHTQPMRLIHGDCLEVLPSIPNSSVDAIICDPPYGTIKGAQLKGWDSTTTQWDTTIEHSALLDRCNSVLRPNGVLILFCQDPYTRKLMSEQHSNLPFSYRLTWLKDSFGNVLGCNKAPVNYTEDICVFFKKYDTLNQHPLREYARTLFNHIGKNKKEVFIELGSQGACHFMRFDSTQFGLCTEKTYDLLIDTYMIDAEEWFQPYSHLLETDRRFSRRFNLPSDKKVMSNVLQFKKPYGGLHPTQKPLALMEYLIRTYTNPGDTVLDFAMGSGTTGVAAFNTDRRFIGIEKDPHYFNIATDRIDKAVDDALN